MAPCKRQVNARGHLVCDHCHSFVDFALSGCSKSWAETMEEDFTFQCAGSWKVECHAAEVAKLTDTVKGMEMRITKEADGRGRNEQGSDKKDEDRRLRGGRARAGRKVNDQVDATRRSYSEAVIEGALRTERVFMGDSILRKTDKTLSKGDVVVCLPGARIEHVTERVENTLGHSMAREDLY